ncbi:MAG: hypothetical protein L6R42_006992 [Xanthoria sp. 1 TBL-2021]|nr:MAG: hypothetical protein L6R42_006992 [Xanthoria sp. 1 TBL-2021]
MSSRAMRRLQREQEQREQLQNAPDNLEEDGTSEEEQPKKPKAQNAFDMLDQADLGEGEEPIENDDSDLTDAHAANQSKNVEEGSPATSSSKPPAKPKKKPKKKKMQEKSVEKNSVGKLKQEDPAFLDEIDLALRSLSTQLPASQATMAASPSHESFPEMYRLLAVDSRNLNAANEMKRLFGSAVLGGENEEPGPPRRRGRLQHLDLGGALAGRNSPVSRGQGLAGLALRRNVFISGKEEWPKATSGGLGMELVEKLNDSTTEYRFVHNTTYQDVQRQFETCVESLDPQRLIHLLQYNPYHISTLLQVSEIAKQQGDHSVSGDLLERALFSFGRSVHSSFIIALSDGKARLDFRRPENREFWLAAWRYVANLGQRGTWRTSYEWAKLVLSLDPEGDPFCIAINLDQLAIRGGQAEHFLSLCTCAPLDQFLNRPNLRISSALAQYRLKDAQGSRAQLREAIRDYPYIFTRLFQELKLDHLPKSIWGQKARSSREGFECEVYLHNAKDLWNTPEAISFLVEVAESLESRPTPSVLDKDITLDEARHILLSGTPSLINLLPRMFTTMNTSSSDPLPPPDNLSSYSNGTGVAIPQAVERSDSPPARGAIPAAVENGQINEDEAQELQGLQNFFSRIVPWFRSDSAPTPDGGFEQAAAESGVPQEVITERGGRLVQLLRRVIGGSSQDGQPGAPGQVDPGDLGEEEFIGEPAPDGDAEDGALVELPDPNGESGPFEPAPVAQTSPTPQQEPYDDEKNQRWLAGQGMIRLRDFTAQHGTDEHAWGSHTSEGEALVSEYVARVKQLRQARTRDFIVNYPLTQGTSAAVRDLVKMRLEP